MGGESNFLLVVRGCACIVLLIIALYNTRMVLKRTVDVIVALISIILLLPVYILLSLLVFFSFGGPILFTQMRPGLNGKLFQIFKFRSMQNLSVDDLLSEEDSKRMGSFSRFFRSTSLDELPQLWNVLRGDMSLIGPRPLLEEYMPLYNPRQRIRHNVRPGITGWAQVNGRNGLSWEEKFEFDVWYVENQSFWLDIKILLLTFKKVFKREDITSLGHVSSVKFEGNKQ